MSYLPHTDARRLPHRSVLPRLFVLLAIFTSALAVSTPHLASATDADGGLSIQPVSSSPQGGVTNRPTFIYDLDPGAVQNDAVVVSNNADTPKTVTVYVANAFTVPSGLIGVQANEHAKTGPAEWLKFTTQLANNTFELAGLTSKTIPFAITIPPNAPPGDYAFGIAVAPQVEITPVPGQNTVQIVQAAATLVELRVQGPLIPIIRVGSLKVSSEAKLIPGFVDGSTRVAFEVVNVGNQRVNTVIHITERNAFDVVIHREPEIKLGNVLPGSKVKLTRSWNNTPYIKGSVTIEITTGTATSATRSANFWSVSWRTFVVPGLILLAGFAIYRRIRRRRRERDERELEALMSNGSGRNGSRSSAKPPTGAARP